MLALLLYKSGKHVLTVGSDRLGHVKVDGTPDFECYIKSGRCETLKAHKKQLEAGRFRA